VTGYQAESNTCVLTRIDLPNSYRVKAEVSGYGIYDWLCVFLPILRWLPSYNWRRNLLVSLNPDLASALQLQCIVAEHCYLLSLVHRFTEYTAA
jgi:hypothetical protein